ncbi:MAG: hypothetical protein KGI45_04045, partial [Patescibacteria group bacterium]|nr:hypothetical protein [Patescibacteria group bacterium]MDE1967206.1 hypothetical protein [Patescibacteria group bacterium]
YETNRGKYKVLKEALIEDIDAFIKPLRDKREKIAGDVKKVQEILARGAIKAKKAADAKLMQAKEAIGVM